MSDISTIEDYAARYIAAPTQAFMTSGLPGAVKALILATIRNPQSGPDQLLILADALVEVGTLRRWDSIEGESWQRAAAALRDLANLELWP